MPLDKSELFALLKMVDEHLERKITIVAAGGTAMTLLDAKPSTLDIDFTGPGKDIDEFRKVEKTLAHGFKMDLWKEGQVFSQFLPDNYLDNSIIIRTDLKKIELRALHPVDIVATKIGRLDARDHQDIEICVKKFGLRKNQIKKRAGEIEYAGNEHVFQANVQYALKTFF